MKATFNFFSVCLAFFASYSPTVLQKIGADPLGRHRNNYKNSTQTSSG
ncbi:TPA_asm: hypothetical protein [Porphyromonas phage phage016a_WW2866]|uniref:Uncharacterized protein n=1 Tax=Porphyromonas phage phage016a_WW2866 TaxID=3154106 RepID=A0AAT9JBL4_9CAUD